MRDSIGAGEAVQTRVGVECDRSAELLCVADIGKILRAWQLQRAEVVELADTPSAHIALAVLYKLLIINLLPFASITSGNVPRNGQ
jgi:hypothetical protein